MSAFGPFTTTVLNSMVAIFRDQFEGRFRSVYEDTVKIRRAAPLEAKSEVFNAFEHLSLACKNAAEADAAAAAADTARTKSQKNLAQAERHLSVGRFFCIEHQIVQTIDDIRQCVQRLPDDQRAAKSGYQQRCDDLSNEFSKTSRIEIQPIDDPSELAKATQEFEKSIEAMTILLNKFLQLAGEIVGPSSA